MVYLAVGHKGIRAGRAQWINGAEFRDRKSEKRQQIPFGNDKPRERHSPSRAHFNEWLVVASFGIGAALAVDLAVAENFAVVVDAFAAN